MRGFYTSANGIRRAARGFRVRCVRNAVRRAFGAGALRVVRSGKRPAAFAALAREAARVHLAAQPDAALRPLLQRDARSARLCMRSARAGTERGADARPDG